MNTKPRAKKFRVSRSLGLSQRAQAAHPGDGVQAKAAPPPRDPQPTEPASAAPSPRPRADGASPAMTPRQAHMIRRLAERRGIKASSDREALEELRKRGIDPLAAPGPSAGRRKPEAKAPPPQDPTIIRPEPKGQQPRLTPVEPPPTPAVARTQLPRTVEQHQVPAEHTPVDDAEARRIAEISRMQRDIARRRRIKLIGLGARLTAFVAIPTILAFMYFSYIATPMYSTKSEFLIQQADSPASAQSSFLSGTSLANSQDSIAVQSYLQSREAMLRLDEEIGFKARFADPSVDALQRLPADATNEEAYRRYQKSVRIGYDPTEGIIRMEVIAPDPQVSLAFSNALIGYAEEQVDQMTLRIRTDQMSGALASLADAEAKMIAAQRQVLTLQEARGVLSAEAEVQSLMGQISTFEVELKQEKLSLQALMDNARPNRTKVEVAERNIARLEALIADMRSEMTESTGGGASLARITGELVIAEAELATRQEMVSQTMLQVETARIEANRQVRYLLMGVSPTPPDEASYPRAFENTVLAFFIFAGVYLMLSLTASILREQVSA